MITDKENIFELKNSPELIGALYKFLGCRLKPDAVTQHLYYRDNSYDEQGNIEENDK